MFNFSKLTIHDNIPQEDEILNEIESKLTFTEHLNDIDDVTMEDYEPSFKDEDISMQDCTDFDYKHRSQDDAIFINNELGSVNERENVVKKAEEQLEFTGNDKTERGSKSLPGDATSLVNLLLKPEIQGYKLGISSAEKRATYDDNNHDSNDRRHEIIKDVSVGNFNEDNYFASENQTKKDLELVFREDPNFTNKHNIEEEGSVNLSKDTTTNGITIHNHFYNNIFNPSVSERNSLSYNDNNNTKVDHNNLNSEVAEIARPNSTLVGLEFIKKSINYSIVIYFLFMFLRNIRDDASKEYERAIVVEELKIKQCQKEYLINRCDEYGQLPELKGHCLEWLSCFSEKPTSGVFYTEMLIKLIGRQINGFLGSLSHMSKIFLLIVLFVWYIGNFIIGYIKGCGEFVAMNRTDVGIQSRKQRKVKWL